MILTEESRIFPLKQPGLGGGSEMLVGCQRQDGEIGPDLSSRLRLGVGGSGWREKEKLIYH